ncbi:MAG: apolipoprotein N-acyltransferase [Betaproteobacteria bacterium]
MDYSLAFASGALLALSFPKFGHPALGWIALAPLLVALGRGSLSRAFGLGLTAGLVYFAGTLYWITHVMVVYGGLATWVAVPINVALVAYLALFPALFAVIMRRLMASHGPEAVMMAPFVWVATELGRAHLFTGFPWVLLGYSQAVTLPIAQVASLFGVFGVSALVASVSAAAALFALTPRRRPGIMAAVSVGVLLLGAAAWGSWRVGRGDLTRQGDAIRIGLVQGDVDQAEKWDAARATSIFDEYLRMTRQAIAGGAQFVVWPESSAPFYFEEDRLEAGQVRAIARQAHVPILVGSDQIERGVPTRYYNSAFLVRSDGTVGGVYRKMHLVPFGEYVPLKSVFFFAAPLVEAVSDFSPGTQANLLPVDGHLVSTAICYEIVYPDLVRRFVRGGSQLLTTITNDAWFGSTSAPYQHFEQASMRAVEEGRYLVRSANTGISGIVDPYGRVLEKSRLFAPAVMLGEVRFVNAMTLYARIGDVLAYASAVLTLVALALARRVH